jgi:putative phosphoesterase
MLIGILSDSHGRVGAVRRALGLLRERGVGTVLHCGDIDDAATVALFRGWDAHFVYGNCDRDRDRDALRAAIRAAGVTLHEGYGSLELEGVRIAFVHGDDRRLLRDLERSGHYDYLFYGHTHRAAEHRAGPTRVLNPGALHRARPKTFAVLDLAAGSVERVEVPVGRLS